MKREYQRKEVTRDQKVEDLEVNQRKDGKTELKKSWRRMD